MREDLINELSMPKQQPSIITVIGVGGAGGNALDYMWKTGIKGVNFLACNTDQRALDNLSLPDEYKIVLGDGQGAGNNPERGQELANKSLEQIKEYVLSKGTRMVFITAGMGGGTGTGASPVIAKMAHDEGMLTVANVTSPLLVEGPMRCKQAAKGIEELQKYADSLLVINNESIREMYGKLPIREAFGMADDILAAATKGIAELVTVESAFIRVDFADLDRVMRGSGRAHMGVASAAGEDRALEAARRSLCSPLLNNNEITGAKKILINISAADVDTVMYDEAMKILTYIQSYASYKDEDGVEQWLSLRASARTRLSPLSALPTTWYWSMRRRMQPSLSQSLRRFRRWRPHHHVTHIATCLRSWSASVHATPTSLRAQPSSVVVWYSLPTTRHATRRCSTTIRLRLRPTPRIASSKSNQ